MRRESHRNFSSKQIRSLVAFAVGLTVLCAPGAFAQDEDTEREGIGAKRKTVDETIFMEAAQAEEYGEAIVALWDSIREAENPLEVFRTFNLGSVEAPDWKLNRRLPEKIFEFAHRSAASGIAYLKSYQIQTRVNQYIEEGYQIDQVDFRHAEFEIDARGVARSRVKFELNISGPLHTLYRRSFRGTARVVWSEEPGEDEIHYPQSISFENFRQYRRTGKPGFVSTEWLDGGETNSPYAYITVEDYDLDGSPDVLFPRKNFVYLNVGDFRFDPRPILESQIPGVVDSALLIDLDLDGRREYVINLRGVGVLVFEPHKKTGKFSQKPKTVFKSRTLFGANSLSAGDINGDGLPDLFIGQNVEPYVRGILPVQFYDSNDSLASYLLINQGNFKFKEAIEQSAVAEKSKRRNRSSVIVDLNGDGFQDLALNSNFAGLDLFAGDGKGLIEDRTSEWASDTALFGSTMSLADFNRDGVLDLFAGGQASDVGLRLTAMGASRPDYKAAEAARGEIAQGSRLWLGKSGGGLARSDEQDAFTRAGAVWGSSDLDFNNDGYPDIFLTNGYFSKTATRDYDELYWRHDVYDAEKENRVELAIYLNSNGPTKLLKDEERSWFPYQKNKLLANFGEEGFVDIAYLMGLSSDMDSQATVSEDLNGDGKADLIAITKDSIDGKVFVNILENQMLSVGNWIGVQLKPVAKRSVVGAKIRVIGDSFEAVKAHVFGSARNVQPSSLIRFGIGESDTVKAIEIIWADGQTQRLESPEINRYHSIVPGA